MQIFTTTLNQMLVMFIFMALGFFLNKKRLLPLNDSVVLSRLESYLFVPALSFITFYKYFTYENLKANWLTIVISVCLLAVSFALSIVLANAFAKDDYLKRIYRYAFTCANFGFMGNAVVLGVFGEEALFYYMMFTLPFNMFVYSYGVQSLKPEGGKLCLKSFINPIFIAIILGAVLGFFNVSIPSFLNTVVTTAGNCMSPLAMLLTGFVIGEYSIKNLLCIKRIYLASVIRLIIIPLVFVVVLRLLNVEESIVKYALCTTAMPLGLNTVVFPAAYGGDTTPGASMALISHVMSVITIPIMFGIIL